MVAPAPFHFFKVAHPHLTFGLMVAPAPFMFHDAHSKLLMVMVCTLLW
jgi:hypothetical protein